MSELLEPIKVERRATWEVGTYWRVVREESTGTVSVHGQSGTRLQVSSDVALQLSAAISAAAVQADDAMIDALPSARLDDDTELVVRLLSGWRGEVLGAPARELVDVGLALDVLRAAARASRS